MDGAGGHGGDTKIKEMAAELADKFNIELYVQPANSPETNALDLGVWMSLSSDVHKLRGGKRKDQDVLKATVMEAWDRYGVSSDHIKMEKVFEKIPDIARKTIEQKGGNHFDEAKAAGARVRVVERRKTAAAVAAAAADAL